MSELALQLSEIPCSLQSARRVNCVVRLSKGEALEVHQQALELFGDPNLPLDHGRGLAVTRLAVAAGVTLPAAVAESATLVSRGVIMLPTVPAGQLVQHAQQL